MSSLKMIREKLGVSQQEIAQWLGISRSLAEHYEHGIRSLPTHALVKLSKLEIMIGDFETAYGKVEQTNAEELLKAVSNQDNLPIARHPKLALEMDKADNLYRQLGMYKSKHAVLQQQLMLIQNMMDKTSAEAGEKEKLWLQMLYHSVSYKMSKYDEAKQLPFKAKIMEMKLRKDIERGETGV